MLARILIFVALAIILGIPFAMRPAREAADEQSLTLIIVTPHIQQIRTEFSVAFDRWHRHHHGQGVAIDWRTPGGTSEIVKQLQAQYAAAAKSGRFDFSDPANPTAPIGAIGFDIMFGGGSYDHGRLKSGVTVQAPDGQQYRLPIAVPAGFPQSQLDEWYGENSVGAERLYDPEQYWLGTALSSFGIVYSRDALAELGLPEPRSFEDLTDPLYIGTLALADPRQSGSITTAFDSILNNEGWDRGWRILREMTANSRYFTNSATKPPIDVSAGEAAAGLAIDFYGRGQAQSITRPGETPEEARVGYIDPPGRVYVDADPVTILRAGPHPDLARRFVEFCLTEEAQTLWQFPALTTADAADNPLNERGDRMGPERHQLRRMPVRRSTYEKYLPYFVDKVNPFEFASSTTVQGWRSAIGPMMGAFAIDIADEQRAAWAALNRARASPTFPPEHLAEMERLFYAWPAHEMPDGTSLDFNLTNYSAIRATWRDADVLARSRIAYTGFFRETYREVRRIAAESLANP